MRDRGVNNLEHGTWSTNTQTRLCVCVCVFFWVAANAPPVRLTRLILGHRIVDTVEHHGDLSHRLSCGNRFGQLDGRLVLWKSRAGKLVGVEGGVDMLRGALRRCLQAGSAEVRARESVWMLVSGRADDYGETRTMANAQRDFPQK